MLPTLPELSEQLQHQRDRPLTEIRQAETALDAARRFGSLSDQQLVEFVRETYGSREHWWSDQTWKDAVNLEIQLRRLLQVSNPAA